MSQPPVSRTTATSTPCILVVDDVPANLRLVASLLAVEGYRVDAVPAAGPALERLAAGGVDLVVLDAMMPGVDGFELCRLIKADESTRHVPVILLTALRAIDDKMRGEQAGADDFVSKPFDRAELVLRVRALLRIKAMHDDLQRRIDELEVKRLELRRLADTDGLTGLFNKRYLESALVRELERAGRYEHPLSVIMLDLDHFKLFNDRYGHRAGDALLVRLSALIRETLRTVDVAARWGGEEFAIVLPESGADAAAAVAERLRERLAGDTELAGPGPVGGVSASIGVATFPEDALHGPGLIETADRRMYLAKQSGRDRVVGGRADDGPLVDAASTEPVG